MVFALAWLPPVFLSDDCWRKLIGATIVSLVKIPESQIKVTSKDRPILQTVFRLTMIMAVGWVLCFWPAKMLRPEHGVKWMSIAAICCLGPGWIVVLLERLAIFRGDIKLMLGQMGVRFLAIMGAALVVKWREPQFGLADFYGWLIVFYLLAMVYEVILLREKFALQPTSPKAETPTEVAD